MMTYLFRLSFHTISPGLFRFEEAVRSFPVSDELELTVAARDADTLAKAQRYHIEAQGFSNENAAWAAGERLRVRLRVLSAMLGLGMSVPVEDTTSGRLSDEVKRKILEEHGAVARDSVIGLAVWPDDGRHFECVFSGAADVYPSEPTYLFTSLSRIWALEMRLDERSEDALRFLNLALIEQSARSRFLLTYLASERMVEAKRRSDAAIEIIRKIELDVRRSNLPVDERASLLSGIGRLRERSIHSELKRIGRKNQAIAERYCGKDLPSFISDCIETRHKIAHEGSNLDDTELRAKSDGLRRFCLQLIWSKNQIPDVSLDAPSSAFTMKSFSIRAM